jgi:PAS domain S-box-containing protein
MDTPPDHKLDPSSRTIFFLSAAITALCVTVYLLRPALVEYLQWKWTDRIVMHTSARPPTDKIAVVDIDEDTIASCGQWPWPRFQLARLLDAIADMGADAIALDFIMSEPDRTSLQALQQSLSAEFGYQFNPRSIPAKIADNDAILAETLSRGRFVLGYEFLFDASHGDTEACNLHRPEVLRIHNSLTPGGLAALWQAHGAVCNLPRFTDAATFSGFLNGRSDGDSLMRRLPVVIRFNDVLYPNLALAAILAATGDRSLTLRRTDSGQTCLIFGDHSIPMDASGNVLLDLTVRSADLLHVSAHSILSGRHTEKTFAGRIVFVGLGASGLTETYQTPGNERLSAVGVQALLAETIISQNYIRRPSGIATIEVFLAAVFAALVCICITRFEFLHTVLAGAAGIVCLWTGAYLAFRSQQLLFSPLLPVAAIVSNGFLLMLFKYWNRQKTARLRMQDALSLMKRSERNLNSIITTIPDIVFRLDTNGRIIFISLAITKYNKQPEELIGRHILDLVSPEDKTAADYRVNERRTGKRATFNLEIRLLLSTASKPNAVEERYFSVSAEGIYSQPVPNANSFLGTQGIARDIDHNKHLENQLERSKKLEAIGSLAAGVAHDLNNILSGIVSYPDLLLLDLPPDSPMRDMVKSIQQSGERAAAIVQDMLTIARRGVKTQDIINVNNTIKEYLETLEFKKVLDSHTNIEICTQLSDDVMNIKGSAFHLLKVITNLVRNATEAMPSGGTVLVSTRNRYLDTTLHLYETIPEGEYVRVRIQDDGVGIKADDLSRIFEPFYSKKSMDQSGSGLGMTVVWSTVKDHCGYVDVQSAEGEGTRFDLYFPVTREERGHLDTRVVLEDYLGTETVLVVDDIAEQRDIAVRMLSKLGYSVASASSGEEAVALVHERPVDIIVLDMVMLPGMDGFETFQRIRQTHPSQKAIIASGYAESERVKTMLTMGAGAFIRKPYSLEKIGLAVRRALDSD